MRALKLINIVAVAAVVVAIITMVLLFSASIQIDENQQQVKDELKTILNKDEVAILEIIKDPVTMKTVLSFGKLNDGVGKYLVITGSKMYTVHTSGHNIKSIAIDGDDVYTEDNKLDKNIVNTENEKEIEQETEGSNFQMVEMIEDQEGNCLMVYQEDETYKVVRVNQDSCPTEIKEDGEV